MIVWCLSVLHCSISSFYQASGMLLLISPFVVQTSTKAATRTSSMRLKCLFKIWGSWSLITADDKDLTDRLDTVYWQESLSRQYQPNVDIGFQFKCKLTASKDMHDRVLKIMLIWNTLRINPSINTLWYYFRGGLCFTPIKR